MGERIQKNLPFELRIPSQIFLYFSLNYGSLNVGNNDELAKRYGKVTWLHSHELSAIAEIQHLNSCSRSTK